MITTETKPASKETILAKELEKLAFLGRSFAPEFICALADSAFATIIDWLKANGAPEEIIALINQMTVLYSVEQALIRDNLGMMNAVSLTEEIPEITQLIAKLGGTFQGENMPTYPREPIQWTCGAEEKQNA